MRILAAQDSIFKYAEEYEPWFPEPDRDTLYRNDAAWQKAHLWDHHTESDNFHGPYRGPTILHHPDLQYALDNGWRVVGGPKAIDHQSRGEASSGSKYLYKIGEDGLIHHVHMNMGPEDTNNLGEGYAGDEFDQMYGTAPEDNWRHLITSEGGTSEGPTSHNTLRELIDDEKARSMDPTHQGYKDFEPLPSYRGQRGPGDVEHEKRYQNSLRRAWETGTNDPHKHYNDPIPDPYANLRDIPRRGEPLPDLSDVAPPPPKTPRSRYGSTT
jgi:hypothetical protein